MPCMGAAQIPELLFGGELSTDQGCPVETLQEKEVNIYGI